MMHTHTQTFTGTSFYADTWTRTHTHAEIQYDKVTGLEVKPDEDWWRLNGIPQSHRQTGTATLGSLGSQAMLQKQVGPASWILAQQKMTRKTDENGTFLIIFKFSFLDLYLTCKQLHIHDAWTFVCIPIHFCSPIATATHFYLLGEKATAWVEKEHFSSCWRPYLHTWVPTSNL